MYHEARIEELWQQHQHQPKMQALVTAYYCLRNAPELARTLIERIAAQTPPEIKSARPKPFETKVDERLVAIGLLTGCITRNLQAYNPPMHQLPLPEAADSFSLKLSLRDICTTHFKIAPRRGAPMCAPTQKMDFEMAGSVILQPSPSKTPADTPKPDTQTIRVDWELGRLSIALNLAAPFRLWILAREITRTTNGSGVITRQALWSLVQHHQLAYTRRHFNRLLQNGDNLLWRCADDALYLSSIRLVGRSFSQLAAASGVPLSLNMPGVRQVLLDVSGSHEQWEAMLYAGWIAGRSAKGKSDHVTIARATLSGLFGRHEITLRRWEATRLSSIVSIRHNVAQYVPDDLHQAPIITNFPAHTRPYLARVRTLKGVIHEVRLYWQIANTYSADLTLYDHKGQAEKVRKASHSVLCNPADNLSGGQVRWYYADAKALKKRMRSRKLKMGLLGDPTRQVYVFLGMHRRSLRGVFEWTNRDLPLSHPDERSHPARESAFFAGEGHSEMYEWQTRHAYMLLNQ